MTKQMVLLGLVLSLLLTGCSYNDEKVATVLLGPEIMSAATIKNVEYLPNGKDYYAFIEMNVQEEQRTTWLNENFTEADCTAFKVLYESDYVSKDWADKSDTGSCYYNASVVTNELAPYNEISLLLYDNDILLYAAGTKNEVQKS